MARARTYPARPPALLAWLALAVVLAILAWAPGAWAKPRLPQRGEIMQRLKSQGQVRVLVKLADPGLEGLKEASRAERVITPERRRRARTLVQPWADQALAQRIGQAADDALKPLAGKPHQVLRRYRQHPWLALRVGPKALAALEESDQIEMVQMDRWSPVPQPSDAPSLATADKDSGEGGSASWLSWPAEDGPGLPLLDNTVGIVGATQAWDLGYTGAGWYVAILDTGIRANHEFFAGKDIVEACYTTNASDPSSGYCPNGSDEQIGPGSAAHHSSSYTGWDHGTHVAGIAAGHKADDSLNGVAKGADIMAIQVFSIYNGSLGSWGSDQAAAMEYVYANRATYPVAAVNMSLGSGAYSSQTTCDNNNSLVKSAIDDLRAVGIATAIASGNNGYCGYISGPGCISSAMAVGASTDADAEASFSNFDETLLDIFAPGQSINSSTADGTSTYESWNGTSMATPHVTGAWAVIRQNRPDDTVDQIVADMLAAGQTMASNCTGNPTKPRLNIAGVLSCVYALSANSQAAAAIGDSGSFDVTTNAGCPWTAVSDAAWITVTGGTSGTGDGTVSFTVVANDSTASRQGTITAGGQTFTVTQAPCNWVAVSNDAWITITSGGCGVAGGAVQYAVESNYGGQARTGTITIADDTFTVTQMGAGQVAMGRILANLLQVDPATWTDSDGDGIPDYWEQGSCPGVDNPDSDGDGILDGLEDANHNGQVDTGETNPCATDSDGDGIPDGVEDANHNGQVDTGETDPRATDSDGDGIADGVEDADHNGQTDAGETDPTNRDSDGDGYNDNHEITAGADPLDPSSFPPSPSAWLHLLLPIDPDQPPPPDPWGENLMTGVYIYATCGSAAGHEPALAVDGDEASFWASNDNLDTWVLRWDMGGDYAGAPERFGMLPDGDGWWGVQSFKLQALGNDGWVDLLTTQHDAGLGQWQYWDLSPDTYRYYRLFVYSTYGSGLPSLGELSLQESVE